MHKTMFDTPVINAFLRWISLLFLKVTGWKLAGQMPSNNNFVLIAAPHTSNWDLPYLLAFAFLMRTKIYWLGKKQIFKPPFKHIMQWMGGIPVDRSQSNNLVEYAAHLLRSESNLKIVVTPEGTRAKITHWKTGFYHIARLAEVPIVFAYLDYSKRIGGIGGQLLPSGNIDSDMKIIKAFYADIKGKKPLNYE